MPGTFTVKTWAGEIKPVKKISFYPEADANGNIFYKIEGQIGSSSFMVDYSYDREKAWDNYILLLQQLTAFQVNNITELQA